MSDALLKSPLPEVAKVFRCGTFRLRSISPMRMPSIKSSTTALQSILEPSFVFRYRRRLYQVSFASASANSWLLRTEKFLSAVSCVVRYSANSGMPVLSLAEIFIAGMSGHASCKKPM